MARSFLGHAMYRPGVAERAIADRDEAGDRTADELYGEADARRAHADAAFAVEHVRDALLTDESS